MFTRNIAKPNNFKLLIFSPLAADQTKLPIILPTCAYWNNTTWERSELVHVGERHLITDCFGHGVR